MRRKQKNNVVLVAEKQETAIYAFAVISLAICLPIFGGCADKDENATMAYVVQDDNTLKPCDGKVVLGDKAPAFLKGKNSKNSEGHCVFKDGRLLSPEEASALKEKQTQDEIKDTNSVGSKNSSEGK